MHIHALEFHRTIKNIKMLSYQCKVFRLNFTLEMAISGKTVFILRRCYGDNIVLYYRRLVIVSRRLVSKTKLRTTCSIPRNERIIQHLDYVSPTITHDYKHAMYTHIIAGPIMSCILHFRMPHIVAKWLPNSIMVSSISPDIHNLTTYRTICVYELI